MSDDEQYLLKPMNCPHHIMIYKSKPRSYRDLPVRLAEFGTVYRYEQSGELGGHDPRARLHAGRRPHVLHRGASGRRVPRLHRDDADGAPGARAERLSRAARLSRSDERQVRRQRRELEQGRGGDRAGRPRDESARLARPSAARRRFTGRRSISSSPIASAANGNWAPCSWTTTCRAPSDSRWNTSGPTTSRIGR